jgi:hypothetical protein
MENKNLLSKIKIDIDGNELVHSITYSGTHKEIISIIKPLNDYFYKRRVNELFSATQTLVRDLSGHDSDPLLLDLVLGKIRKDIQIYKGEMGSVLRAKNVSSADLLCRCKGITYKELEVTYLAQKGDRKQVLFESEVSGICGACKTDFEAYFKILEEEKSFVNGLDSKVWIDRIDKAVEEFYFVCPPEYSNLKFEVININVHNLKIKCVRGESTLKRPEIQATLSNFLKSELKLEMPIKIIV